MRECSVSSLRTPGGIMVLEQNTATNEAPPRHGNSVGTFYTLAALPLWIATVMPGQTNWTLRNKLRGHIFVSETKPTGLPARYPVNTVRFAALAP